MRAYFFCVIFTQLFGNSNYYPYFCAKRTPKKAKNSKIEHLF